MQPKKLVDRIRGGDEVVVTVFGFPITTNELHGIAYGAVLGLMHSMLRRSHPDMAMLSAFSITLLALGLLPVVFAVLPTKTKEDAEELEDEAADSLGGKTLLHEPHYPLVVMWIIFGGSMYL